MGDERTEPGEIDPGSQPTATHFTSTAGAPAFSGFGESSKKIGGYRVLGLLGQGGMGIVYRAEQQNPQRIVALKVIRLGIATSEHLRRFEQEAKLLGRLQHPGIAQIYEAGTENSGGGDQPYFAMEFIQGLPLLQYANTRNLGTRDRVELIAKICDAVHHAHQRGIIHRDLKPTNILIAETEDPRFRHRARHRLRHAGNTADGHGPAHRYACLYEPGTGAGRSSGARYP